MDRRRLSKWLAWGLRHDPAGAGFAVDPAGWANVGEVLAAARRAGLPLDAETLSTLVLAESKGRYALRDGLIRANHGHSIPVELGVEATSPPERLYHGTVQRLLADIRRDGLHGGTRRYVHLSIDLVTAREVGSRRGRPIVLEIDAAAMAADGHRFWQTAGGVWLVEVVPPGYLRVTDRDA